MLSGQIFPKPPVLHFHPRTKERSAPPTEHREQAMACDDLLAWSGRIEERIFAPGGLNC
jgi:hypothetical protein